MLSTMVAPAALRILIELAKAARMGPEVLLGVMTFWGIPIRFP